MKLQYETTLTAILVSNQLKRLAWIASMNNIDVILAFGYVTLVADASIVLNICQVFTNYVYVRIVHRIFNFIIRKCSRKYSRLECE